MIREFKKLRRKQLDRSLQPFIAAGKVARPARGWLHAIREGLGMSAADLAAVMGTSRQLPLAFERAEAKDTITLKSLRNVANAMDCELVYALVPRAGSIEATAEARARTMARAAARERVLSVEHSMALEDQAAGGVGEMIENETERVLGRVLERGR
jgi:predicted DNA-binding mobile mystery protein A